MEGEKGRWDDLSAHPHLCVHRTQMREEVRDQSRPVNWGVLVHVLVHVRTGILFWLVHHRAIFADVLCVESKGDVRIIARVCRTMQCVVKWTHNPLVGGSNPSGPTIESTTCGLRQCPGFGACDVIVTYQKRPRCLACGQWIFVHHGAHPFQTRMLVDHGRLRVGMAQ